MKTIPITLLVIASLQTVFAQMNRKVQADSMIAQLAGMKEDTTKVRLLADICDIMSELNPEAALKLGMVGLHMAERLYDLNGQAYCHLSIAGCYDNMRKVAESTTHYQEALLLSQQCGNIDMLCFSGMAMASNYIEMDTAITILHMSNAIPLLTLCRDVKWKARSYWLLGKNYLEMGKPDSAEKCFQKTLSLTSADSLGWEYNVAKSYMGYVRMDRGELDSAWILLQDPLMYFKAIGSDVRIAEIVMKLSEIRILQSMENGPDRESYLREGEVLAKEAIAYANKVGYPGVLAWTNKLLSDIYQAEGKYKEALEHILIGFDYYRRIFNAANVTRASFVHWKYQNELNQKQLELLRMYNRQQLTMIVATGIIAVILVIVVFFVISNRRKLQKAYLLVNDQKEEIECQNEELETTMEHLKQTQSQLIQSEKMASLGMLTAGIAHEINNPVNFINSGAISLQRDYEDLHQFIQSMEQQFPDTQKLAENLGVEELLKIIPQTIADIKTGVSRTSEIVKGLRNFTRMDATELKEADIHEGIDSTLLLLSHKTKDRIRIVKEYDNRIGYIKCYPGPLNQVFMNLINNAIDAIDQKLKDDSFKGEMPDTKSVGDQYQIGIKTKLTGEGMNKQVKIVISDNGVGIRDEIRDKLFDPFFTTKEVGKGTGLGLSICHGIIEKHGGTITFESKVGEGTAFTIILPVE